MAVRQEAHTPTTWLNRLWPAAFGLAFAAFNMIGLAQGADLAPILVGAAFVYLGASALQRRGASWPVFWLVFVVIGVSKVVGGPDSTWVLLGVAAVFAVYGAVRNAQGLPRQALAMAVFGGAAAATVLVGGDFGAYLVAAALLAHSGWDAYHLRTGKVVSRSMAEFCFVLDAVVAIAMIVVVVIR
jgi:hypothetical protein